MNFDHLREKLEKNGFTVSVFATGEEAAAYLNEQIDQRTVGMGGSMTIAELGLRESLSRHNVVFSHGFTPAGPGPAAGRQCGGLPPLRQRHRRGHRGDSQHRRHRQPDLLLPLRTPEGLSPGGPEQDLPQFPQRPPAGAQRGGPQERPAAGPQDPLRGQGRPLLRLRQPGAHLPGADGALQEDGQHGHGSGAGGPGAGLLNPRGGGGA